MIVSNIQVIKHIIWSIVLCDKMPPICGRWMRTIYHNKWSLIFPVKRLKSMLKSICSISITHEFKLLDERVTHMKWDYTPLNSNTIMKIKEREKTIFIDGLSRTRNGGRKKTHSAINDTCTLLSFWMILIFRYIWARKYSRIQLNDLSS